MKTEDIKRGIVSKHRRQSGGAPALGQVARLRHTEVSATDVRRVRRRGGEQTPERTKRVLLWSAILGLATVLVIGVTISVWLLPRLNETTAEDTGGGSRHEVQVRVESKFPSPSKDQALDLVRRAIANRDSGKLASLFRASPTPDAEILNFLIGLETVDGPIERYDWLSSMDKDGLLVEGVLVVLKGRDKPVERLAFLTPDALGTWKMDFDAFARTVSPSWHELLENGAAQALVRVFVGKDFYYNGAFRDEAQWTCYGIASPDTDEMMRGYCRVGSKQAETMARMFAEGEKMGRATLEIRRVKDAESNQFEITRVLAKDWILTESPDDRS